MDYLNDPFATIPHNTPTPTRSQQVTFTYTPWTPPAKDPNTPGRRPGQQPKPNIHSQAVLDNLNTDVWAQFPVAPAGTNPDDPYDGSLQKHSRDIYRSAKPDNVSVQFFKVNPDGTEERWMNIKTAEFMEDGLAAIIRFKARRKKL